MLRIHLILLLIFFTGASFAQSQDSIPAIPTDTAFSATRPMLNNSDTVFVAVKPVLDTAWMSFTRHGGYRSFAEFIFSRHAFFAFSAVPVIEGSDIRHFHGKEILFYSLVALLLIFAFLKAAFAKYLSDLFRLFFRRTLKQRQITEQLSQTPLPSLLFNSFFMITAGLYIALLLKHFNVRSGDSFWMLSLYAAAGLGAVYFVKFIGLKFTGWVLNMSGATDAYIFIVFIINKVIGIFLLPFLVLLAFTQGNVYQVALSLSWCGLACLFCYRLILSYSAVRNQLKVKPFHFLIYLVAFEIIPLLLIFKLLLYFLL